MALAIHSTGVGARHDGRELHALAGALDAEPCLLHHHAKKAADALCEGVLDRPHHVDK
jgi:hypothetical protein